MKNIFLILCLMTLVSACSIAPFNTSHTARSLGKDNTAVSVELIPALGLRVEQGLSEKFDLGVGIELQGDAVYFLQGKYSFINRADHGLSLAALGGGSYGSGFSSAKSLYTGPVVSYRWESAELFFQGRFNYTKWDYARLKSNANDKLDDLLAIPSLNKHFTYWQLDPGISFLGEKWSTSVGLHYLIFKSTSAAVPFVLVNYNFK